jgi:uncharacterized protein YunC (DUF1805 family)
MGMKKDMSLYTQFGNCLFNLNFFKKNQEPGKNGCINWTGGTHRQGYGMCGGIKVDTQKRFMTVAHRIAAMVKFGRELTHDEFVIHTCKKHNNLCVNPDHLILGDYAKKTEVMIAAGRLGIKKGSRRRTFCQKQNRTYKRTEDEIRWVRTATPKEISEKFGITRARASSWQLAAIEGYKWLDNPNRLPDTIKRKRTTWKTKKV